MDPWGLVSPKEVVTQIGAVGPLDASTANDLANQAKEDAANSGLPGQHNGPADAYRHCIWNCRMAQEIGDEQARDVGNIHEACGNNPSGETAMDLNNNEIGRGLGKPGADCECECMDALRNGSLQTAPGGTPPSNIY